MNRINVSVASLNQIPGGFIHNTENIKRAVNKAINDGSTLVVTPELSITGYGMEDYFSYSLFTKKALLATKKLAEELPKDIVVIVGLPYFHNSYLYNAAAVLHNNKIVGINFKKNLAANGIHYEQRWFTPWKNNESQKVFNDILGYDIHIGVNIFDIEGFKLGIEICEDAWVSNRVASHYFENGVDIIANPSASHFAISKFETRKTLVEDSSRAYGVTYLYANLVGCESGRAIFDGGSLVATDGKITNQGERFHFTSNEVITTTLNDIHSKNNKISSSQRYTDPNSKNIAIKIKTEKGLPTISKPAKSNCISLWEKSTFVEHEEAIRAVSIGLRDWSRKTGVNGYALSLSGGADSALVAVLTYLSLFLEATEYKNKSLDLNKSYLSVFGTIDNNKSIHDILADIMPKYLVTGYQPSSNSGDITKDAAQKVADMLCTTHKVFVVGDIVNLYEKTIEDEFSIKTNWEEHDIFKQNIQARVRSPMIWGVANLLNKLLLTTSNLSEASVGYFTQDGDSSGVLAPICGITKSRVLELLIWFEKHGTELGNNDSNKFKFKNLSFINDQRPTAELRPEEQEDEDDLMPFNVLDKIIDYHIRLNYSPIEVFEELCFNKIHEDHSQSFYAECVTKYFKLFARNQWKRDRQAPGFHIEMNSLDPKTFKRIPLLGNMFEDELNEISKHIN